MGEPEGEAASAESESAAETSPIRQRLLCGGSR